MKHCTALLSTLAYRSSCDSALEFVTTLLYVLYYYKGTRLTIYYIYILLFTSLVSLCSKDPALNSRISLHMVPGNCKTVCNNKCNKGDS